MLQLGKPVLRSILWYYYPVPSDSQAPSGHRTLALIALIAAGEAVFFLPFLLSRVFRPTVLEVFALTNLELGTAYGVYGIVAMVAYFCGGPLADRFAARAMLTIALLTTALGGLVLLSAPDINTLVLLYAAWGITTIALFWAPLIRATREWGGELEQGRAFGLLEGGRGLLAAVTGSILVAVFAAFLPVDVDTANLAQLTTALRQVIIVLISITAATAVLAWWALPSRHIDRDHVPHLSLKGIRHVLTLPAVWLQAIIILCAYVGFRLVDDFALYASDILGMNDVDAAKLPAVSLWVRPIAAVAAGVIADRISARPGSRGHGAGRMTLAAFLLLAAGSALLASGVVTAGLEWLFLLTVIATSVAIYALRGLYFAIMQEGAIPLAYTGSAVGFVSLIGYTPDVFMGPLMGWLLDRSPGITGHQHVFLVVTGFAIVGMFANAMFQRVTRTQN